MTVKSLADSWRASRRCPRDRRPLGANRRWLSSPSFNVFAPAITRLFLCIATETSRLGLVFPEQPRQKLGLIIPYSHPKMVQPKEAAILVTEEH
jgi:hypothetical protein